PSATRDRERRRGAEERREGRRPERHFETVPGGAMDLPRARGVEQLRIPFEREPRRWEFQRAIVGEGGDEDDQNGADEDKKRDRRERPHDERVREIGRAHA